jgi:hypothetical protein
MNKLGHDRLLSGQDLNLVSPKCKGPGFGLCYMKIVYLPHNTMRLHTGPNLRVNSLAVHSAVNSRARWAVCKP